MTSPFRGNDNKICSMDKIQVGNLAVAVSDAGDGPPVVLLHGLACGKRMWFHQIRALRRRFRVIAYDLRGHGQTDAPPLPRIIPPRIWRAISSACSMRST